MPTVAFGYKCQECGQGTVMEKVIEEYHTKIKGYPFVVKNARVGICDRCDAEHFAARETDRWERLFEQEHDKFYLQPEEIRGFRKELGLSMEQFAFFIGCTRQSLYNWERANRNTHQSRMADLLIKLARESHKWVKVDVKRLLAKEAEKFGVSIVFGEVHNTSIPKAISLSARKIPKSSLNSEFPSLAKLAAETKGEEVVALFSESDEPIGKLTYDFCEASIELELIVSFDFDSFDSEIHFTDGQTKIEKNIQIEKEHARLLSKTKYKDEDVSSITLFPNLKNKESGGKTNESNDCKS